MLVTQWQHDMSKQILRLKSWFEDLIKPPEDDSLKPIYLYMRIFHYIRPYMFRFIISLIITIPIGAMEALIALLLKPFMDGFQHKNMTNFSVEYIPFIIVGLTAVQGILQYLSIYLTGWLGFTIVNDIRKDMLKKMLLMELRYFEKASPGVILQRYFRDPDSLQNNLLANSKVVLTRLFSSLCLFFVLIYTSWKLSIFAIFISLAMLYPSTTIQKFMKNFAREITRNGASLIALYTEAVAGIRVLQVYGLQKHQIKTFDNKQAVIYNRIMKRTKMEAFIIPSMHVISSIGIAGVIYLGGQLVVGGEMTVGALLTFLVALIMLYNPLKNMGKSLINAQLSMFAINRIFQILDQKPKLVDKPDAIPFTGVHQSIIFNDVRFGYTSSMSKVFENLNFTISKGEIVGLVGRSGCGKSTITSLLTRFYDVKSGSITIDGINIQNYQLKSLRKNIAIILQENFLFNGTLRENIMLGNLDATEEELYKSVEDAYLKDFIESLTPEKSLRKGLETQVGEFGVQLSGGQRQRIAIARALLKDSHIVILDEATSALDNHSEIIVQKALDALLADRMGIIIAHRLSTLRNVDRILVLEQGVIVEEGTHSELLAKDGAYTALYHAEINMPLSDEPSEHEDDVLDIEPFALSFS
jgi:ATP-binding cassette, subfamily B, bacterial MsbA